MNTLISPSGQGRAWALATLRWSARVLSLVSIGLIALFATSGGSAPTAREWLAIALFPVGVVVGMILGWWRELTGGLISVGSLAAFYALFAAMSGKFPAGPYFLVFAVPGFLFLAAGLMARLR